MKRKLYFLAILMCFLGALNTMNAQQNKSFSYDFNDGSLDGWRNIDEDGDGYVWGLYNSDSPYSGVDKTYGLASSCYEGSTLKPNNYIVTTSKYLIDETSVFSFVVSKGFSPLP